MTVDCELIAVGTELVPSIEVFQPAYDRKTKSVQFVHSHTLYLTDIKKSIVFRFSGDHFLLARLHSKNSDRAVCTDVHQEHAARLKAGFRKKHTIDEVQLAGGLLLAVRDDDKLILSDPERIMQMELARIPGARFGCRLCVDEKTGLLFVRVATGKGLHVYSVQRGTT